MVPNTSLPPNITESFKDNHVDIEGVVKKIHLILLTLTVVFGIPGNSVVIWVAGFKLEPKVKNVWVVNLAIADLIFSITRIPSLIEKLFYDHWPFGEFYCRLHGFFKYANMFCSVFLLAVISLDRMLCVCKPFFARHRRTLNAVRVVSACVWTTAILFSSPFFFFRRVNQENNTIPKCSLEVKEGDNTIKYALYLNRFLCGFVFPFMVILICYIMAGISIQRSQLDLIKKSRPLRILPLLIIAFFLCWGPYHCLHLVKMVDKKNSVLKIWKPLANGFAYFNSCVNPLLYPCMGFYMKGEVKESLVGICKRALTDDAEPQTTQSNEGSLDESNKKSKYSLAVLVEKTEA